MDYYVQRVIKTVENKSNGGGIHSLRLRPVKSGFVWSKELELADNTDLNSLEY